MRRDLPHLLRIGVFAAACAYLGARANAGSGPGNLEVERLALKDGAGRVRAVLRIVAGLPRFELLDRAGNPRLLLALEAEERPAVALFDAKGVRRAALAQLNATSSALGLMDSQSRGRAFLSMDQSTDAAQARFATARNRQELQLSVYGQPWPASGAITQITATSEDGKLHASMGLDEGGRSVITVNRSDPLAGAWLTIEKEGLGFLSTADGRSPAATLLGRRARDQAYEFALRNERGATLTLEPDEDGVTRLRARDPQGRPLWQLPGP
ncbi:MAG: hypothetical protein ACT4PV_14015 [Planctomycetaceae bacterium]